MAKLNYRYAATIKCKLNGVEQSGFGLIYLESKCKDLTEKEAAAMIQSNTNSAIKGSGKKYHIEVTDLRKLK